MCRGRSGWAAVQAPGGGEIDGQKCGRSTQDDDAAPDHRHLRNNVSPNGDAFRRDAIRLARLRGQHRKPRTHGLKTWMIHG
jgi:hypothetical protein